MYKIQLKFVLLFIALSLINYLHSYTKPNFNSPFIVTSDVDNPTCVKSVDIDNDGYLDILSSSRKDDKIAWYKNDGYGNFGEQKIISTEYDYPEEIQSANIDGDYDNDIISLSHNRKVIACHINDGMGNYDSHIIAQNDKSHAFWEIHVNDIDSDGDIDIITGSISIDKIIYFENDGLGNFQEKIIANGDEIGTHIYVCDLDNDNYKDVISTNFNSQNQKVILFYKNDGKCNFNEPIEIAQLELSALLLKTADLDNDNDEDIIASISHEPTNNHKIIWYRNNGNLNFSSAILVSRDVNYVVDICNSDINNDNFIDIIAASFWGSKINLFENSGKGIFINYPIFTELYSTPTSVTAADIDNDNDLDIIFTLSNDKILCMTNKTYSDIANISLPLDYCLLNQNYPNPFNPRTNIKFTLPYPAKIKISIYNYLGNESKVIANEYKQKGTYNIVFDGTNFSSGIYYYCLEYNNYMFTKKMLLLK